MTKPRNLLHGSIHCISSNKAFLGQVTDRVGGKERALTLLAWFIDSELQRFLVFKYMLSKPGSGNWLGVSALAG